MIMPTAPPDDTIAPPTAYARDTGIAGLAIRAREPEDWPEVAALTELPKVRWGTLRLPFTSKDRWRRLMENPPDGMTGIVATIGGRLVGNADVTRGRGRRSHAGDVGMSVHDDFHGRGIGTAMMAALVDVADNWLDLKRLELTVYADNEPAIRLYGKFGFETEGRRRADAFRGGHYVDSLAMARLRPGWRAVAEPPSFALRPARPDDFLFCQRVTHQTMRGIIDAIWGFDEAEQAQRFARQWNSAEARIIEVGGEPAGWLQTGPAGGALFLKQIYLDSRFQRAGIGTGVIRSVIAQAQRQGVAVVLGVIKINPARRLYERLGFRTTHEDEFKFYMRHEPR
jgi:L-phenylalanine/L-methionine N-acetyltransferase